MVAGKFGERKIVVLSPTCAELLFFSIHSSQSAPGEATGRLYTGTGVGTSQGGNELGSGDPSTTAVSVVTSSNPAVADTAASNTAQSSATSTGHNSVVDMDTS